jgi:hypothetical protein
MMRTPSSEFKNLPITELQARMKEVSPIQRRLALVPRMPVTITSNIRPHSVNRPAGVGRCCATSCLSVKNRFLFLGPAPGR